MRHVGKRPRDETRHHQKHADPERRLPRRDIKPQKFLRPEQGEPEIQQQSRKPAVQRRHQPNAQDRENENRAKHRLWSCRISEASRPTSLIRALYQFNTVTCSQPTLSFVIPVRNDATRLASCLQSIADAARSAAIPVEMIVVDNGSRDRSAEVARAAGATVVEDPVSSVAELRNR